MEKSKEEMEIEIAELEKLRESLFAKKAPIDKKLSEAYRKIEKLQRLVTAQEVTELGSFDERLAYFIKYRPGVDFDLSHKFFSDIGFTSGMGSWRDTHQRCLCFTIDYDDQKTYDKAKKAIETVLPVVEPHKDGYKHFQIMDHGDSGFAYLLVGESGYKVKGSYTYFDRDFGTLDEALKYIQKEHWYEGGPSDYD